MKKKKRVLVALSGGVDSSVAALLMKQQGYDVIAGFMKNWSDTKDDLGRCAWKKERKMAEKVAFLLNIPLKTFDFEKEYRKLVIDKMYEDYRDGLTPNPDVDCNEKVKFPLMLEAMKKLNVDYLVTGHYSRIKKKGKNYLLLRAKDEFKDQSYFLYKLKSNQLEKCLFPIGNLTKKEVRRIAQENGFPNYDKKSTVGICFIGKVNLKKFLSKKIPNKEGDIVNPEGKKIGKHDGIFYYTIGQRLGSRYDLEISKNPENKKFMKRWYVVDKNLKKNIIIAAPEGHPLNYRKEMFIFQPSWINEIPKRNLLVKSRIRQVGELLPSKLIYDKNKKRFKVILRKLIKGISEGQSVVLYKGKKCLGGGEIRFK
jgi:tRNA-specific 2-thiouridylase